MVESSSQARKWGYVITDTPADNIGGCNTSWKNAPNKYLNKYTNLVQPEDKKLHM